MKFAKNFAGTALCWLLAVPCLFSQQSDLSKPAVPKWEFGLRTGVGFTTLHTEGVFTGVRRTPTEYAVGGYLTRHLTNRWSLRSELSVMKTDWGGVNQFDLTLGLYPRYRLNKWMSVEAGLEARQVLSGVAGRRPGLWLGTAFNWKGVELNLRWSPGYQPGNHFSSGGWLNSFQLGMSFNLSKLTGCDKPKHKKLPPKEGF